MLGYGLFVKTPGRTCYGGAVRLRIKDYVAHSGPKLARMSGFHR